MDQTRKTRGLQSPGCGATPESAAARPIAASTSPIARRTPLRLQSTRWVLEPRLVFDGALAATVIEQPPASVEAPAPVEQAEPALPLLAPAPPPAPRHAGDKTAALAATASDGGAEPSTETAEPFDGTLAATP